MLVALGAGFVASTQLGFGWEMAVAAGFAVFAIAATLHVVLRRSEEIVRLQAQVGAMEHELSGLRGAQQYRRGPHLAGSPVAGIPPTPAALSYPKASHSYDEKRSTLASPPGFQAAPRVETPAQSPFPTPTGERVHTPVHGKGSESTSVALSRPGTADAQPELGWMQPPVAARPPIAPVQEPATPTVFVGFSTTASSEELLETLATRSAAALPAAAVTPDEDTVTPSRSVRRAGIFSAFSATLGVKEPAVHKPAPEPVIVPPTALPEMAAEASPRQRVVSGWNAAPAAAGRRPAGMEAPRPTSGQPVTQPRAGGAAAERQGKAGPDAAASDSRFAMPAPANERPSSVSPPPVPGGGVNPVDSLIQAVAQALVAERQGLSTQELLALPAPYPDRDGDHAAHETSPTPADDPELRALAASVRAAIEAGRVELHLQPILALDGLATVSYEAFTRLRDAAGKLIKPADYAILAHRAGLSAGIEKLALLRAIHVLQQLDIRGKLSPIFINVSRELLLDGRFFAEFVAAMKGSQNLSNYLVLEFAQPVACAFDERDLESLDTLARLGFTFALDDVDHVEMDFEALLSRGLAFVKVSADVFWHGLIAGEALIPTNEIKALFEDAGLQLIVHHLSEEAALDVALAHNVTFGQGNLFAEPKPVKAGLMGEASRAA